MKSTLAVVWLAMALIAAACSGDDASTDQAANGDSSDESSLGLSDSSSATTADSAENATTTGGEPAPVSASGGLQLIVFGLRNGTELVMLDMPDGAEIGAIPSGTNNAYFTGEAANSASGELLWKVEYGDLVGWVPPRFGYPAARESITAEVATAFGSASPAQDNPVDTALVVSGLLSFTSPPSGIVVSAINRSDAQGGDVIIDVIDEGAVGVPGVLGHRLQVITEFEASGRYEIIEVWRTPICQNGAANGTCL